jgi:hypothetical protein
MLEIVFGIALMIQGGTDRMETRLVPSNGGFTFFAPGKPNLYITPLPKEKGYGYTINISSHIPVTITQIEGDAGAWIVRFEPPRPIK